MHYSDISLHEGTSGFLRDGRPVIITWLRRARADTIKREYVSELLCETAVLGLQLFAGTGDCTGPPNKQITWSTTHLWLAADGRAALQEHRLFGENHRPVHSGRMYVWTGKLDASEQFGRLRTLARAPLRLDVEGAER